MTTAAPAIHHLDALKNPPPVPFRVFIAVEDVPNPACRHYATALCKQQAFFLDVADATGTQLEAAQRKLHDASDANKRLTLTIEDEKEFVLLRYTGSAFVVKLTQLFFDNAAEAERKNPQEVAMPKKFGACAFSVGAQVLTAFPTVMPSLQLDVAFAEGVEHHDYFPPAKVAWCISDATVNRKGSNLNLQVSFLLSDGVHCVRVTEFIPVDERTKEHLTYITHQAHVGASFADCNELTVKFNTEVLHGSQFLKMASEAPDSLRLAGQCLIFNLGIKNAGIQEKNTKYFVNIETFMNKEKPCTEVYDVTSTDFDVEASVHEILLMARDNAKAPVKEKITANKKLNPAHVGHTICANIRFTNVNELEQGFHKEVQIPTCLSFTQRCEVQVVENDTTTDATLYSVSPLAHLPTGTKTSPTTTLALNAVVKRAASGTVYLAENSSCCPWGDPIHVAQSPLEQFISHFKTVQEYRAYGTVTYQHLTLPLTTNVETTSPEPVFTLEEEQLPAAPEVAPEPAPAGVDVAPAIPEQQQHEEAKPPLPVTTQVDVAPHLHPQQQRNQAKPAVTEEPPKRGRANNDLASDLPKQKDRKEGKPADGDAGKNKKQ